MVGDTETKQDLNGLEEETKAQWSEYEKKNVIYYINITFLCIIWLIAVIAIVSSL